MTPLTLTATHLTDAESEAVVMDTFEAINASLIAHFSTEDGAGQMDITAIVAALGYSLAIYAALRPDLSSRREIKRFADRFSRDLVGMILDAQADMDDAGMAVQ